MERTQSRFHIDPHLLENYNSLGSARKFQKHQLRNDLDFMLDQEFTELPLNMDNPPASWTISFLRVNFCIYKFPYSLSLLDKKISSIGSAAMLVQAVQLSAIDTVCKPERQSHFGSCLRNGKVSNSTPLLFSSANHFTRLKALSAYVTTYSNTNTSKTNPHFFHHRVHSCCEQAQAFGI